MNRGGFGYLVTRKKLSGENLVTDLCRVYVLVSIVTQSDQTL